MTIDNTLLEPNTPSASKESLWEQICNTVKSTLPPHIYSSLIETVHWKEGENKIDLFFPDDFTKEIFEKKCLRAIENSLEKLTYPISLSLQLATQHQKQVQEEKNLPFQFEESNPFDSKYSFDTYVVGTSNQFAHAACQAVSRQPGKCYNPLFIFGRSGLGKTHLLKAIGCSLFQTHRGIRIRLVDAESFTNEVIQAIRTDRMREFREKYRTHCDVLLLDDIHFFVGKDRTQEEFFYTFNYLHESCKQIVISSDRYPKDIGGLETRLQTRFEWGLIADVQPPEIETRIAILQNKAEQEGIRLPTDVAQFIASSVTSSIRSLEGSLRRLQAYSLMAAKPMTVLLAKEVLKDLVPKSPIEMSPEAIIKTVALYFNIRASDLKSDKRIRKHSLPRQICMYLLRKHLMISFPQIGKMMGGKDHTTIMHGVTKVTQSLKTDLEIMQHINSIEGLIQ